jgi:hypothetical protein
MVHARIVSLAFASLGLVTASVSAQPADIRTIVCPGAASINAAGEVSGVYTTDSSTTPLAGISWRGFIAKVEALVVR